MSGKKQQSGFNSMGSSNIGQTAPANATTKYSGKKGAGSQVQKRKALKPSRRGK